MSTTESQIEEIKLQLQKARLVTLAAGNYIASSNAAQAAKLALESTFIYRDSMTPREASAYNKAQYLYDVACSARDEAQRIVTLS